MKSLETPSTRARALRWALLIPLAVVPLVLTQSSPTRTEVHTPVVADASIDLALSDLPLQGGLRADELAFFERRLADDPDDVLAVRRLAALHQMRFRAGGDPGELARSSVHLDRLAERHTGDPALWSMRTSLALATHDFPGALAAAEQRLGLGDPADPSGRYGHFDALWASGRYDEARELLEGIDPERESIVHLSREARLIDGLGDVARSAVIMDRVVELADAWAEPALVRAWARVEHGHFLLHSGSPEASAERFSEALEIIPAYPAALEGLASIAYGVDGRLSAAERLYRAALDHGTHLDLYGVLIEIAEANDDPAAVDSLRSAFVTRATADAASERLYRRPLALTLADDPTTHDRALALAEADLAERQDRMAWATRGWVLRAMGRLDEAAVDAERAVAWGAPTPEVLFRSGVILAEAGEASRGEALVREALEGRAELGPVTSAMLDDWLARR